MTNQKVKLSAKQKSEIREFSWQGFELLVRNSQKGEFINIKLFRDYNKKTKINDIYFLIEEHLYGKKRIKKKKVKLSFIRFAEVYQKLKDIKLGSFLPPPDSAFIGPTIRLEIKRWNSEIIIEWIYNSQLRWKKLDDYILFILKICCEERILKKNNSNSKTYPIGL
jgi:hypothetical protein